MNMLVNDLKTYSANYFSCWEIELINRIKSMLRRIGCIKILDNLENTYNDVPFSFSRAINLKNQYFIIILKKDLPTEFDYYEFLIRKKVIVREICMPLEIDNEKDFILIQLFPGHLFFS